MSDLDELHAALDACLADLERGASLEVALAHYPALAAELRPLLLAAQAAGAGANPARVPVGTQVSSRSQFLARASELRADGRRAAFAPVADRGWWSRLRAWLGARSLARAAVTSLVVLAGLSAGAYGVVSASAQSLPGDPLYGVKRTVESTELLLARDDQARTQLQAEFDRRRIDEVQAVASQRRQVAVDFTGVLVSMEGAQRQQWLVSGVVVLVGPQVPVEGDPLPGVPVRVQGVVQADGSVQAERVTVLPHHSNLPDQTPTPTATRVAPSEQPTQTPSPTALATSSPSATPAPSLAASPTESHESGTASAATPEATEGGDHGGQTQTPQATEGGEHGGLTQTPQATEGGEHGGQTQTPQPTEGGDHGGSVSPSNTPQPTSGGGGPSPSNTPQPTNSDGGGGASPSNTPQVTESGDHSGSGSASPSNTPQPTSSGGGGGSSSSDTPQPDN